MTKRGRRTVTPSRRSADPPDRSDVRSTGGPYGRRFTFIHHPPYACPPLASYPGARRHTMIDRLPTRLCVGLVLLVLVGLPHQYAQAQVDTREGIALQNQILDLRRQV